MMKFIIIIIIMYVCIYVVKLNNFNVLRIINEMKYYTYINIHIPYEKTKPKKRKTLNETASKISLLFYLLKIFISKRIDLCRPVRA